MHWAIIGLLLTQTGGVPPRSIYGAYQDCMMACRTVQIRPDRTFVYRLSGDLSGDARHVGQWTWLGQNRLRAVIPPDTSPPSVAETAVATDDDFTVTVVDEQGVLFGGVTITPLHPEPGSPVATSNEGVAVVPRCPELEIRVLGYVGRFRPADAASTRFEVTLSAAQVSRFALDEVWEVSDGHLFVVHDGSIRLDGGLPKISRSRERAIFGRAAS